MNNTHLSLFSGIGGLDLAAEWAGFRTVAFVERDKYCQRVLAKHWPGVPIYGDVAEVAADAGGALKRRPGDGAAEEYREVDGRRIDSGVWGGDAENAGGHGASIAILSGGFPCQPHSVAGKRKASLDERDLWSECSRITGEFKPRWAVFENVPGLLSSEGGTFFARVLGDLAALGYRVGWGVWGANDVGALHRRDRVFIVARSSDAECLRKLQPQRGERLERGRVGDIREDVADATGAGSQGYGRLRECAGEWATWSGDRPLGGVWSAEPALGRVAHGVPKRVDRLRALGNAVVPQQAYPLFKAIAEIEGITP